MSPGTAPAVIDSGEDYGAHLRRLLLARVRLGSVLAAALIPLGALLEWVARPHLLGAFLPLRLLFGAGCALVYVAVRRWPLPRLAVPLSLFLGLWISVGIEVLVIQTGTHTSGYYAGLCVVIVALGLLFPWDVRTMALACASILALYLLPGLVVAEGAPPSEFWMHAYFITNTAIVALTASHVGGQAREREFFGRLELERRTEELKVTSHRLEDALARQRELDQVKNQLFANVSHELRTPLTVILATLEVFARDAGPLPAQLHGHVRAMHESASGLLRLINDLLDLARLEAGRMVLRKRALELPSLLGTLCDGLQLLAAQKQQRLTLEVGALPPLRADPEKLSSIFGNLLSNALKFGGPQTTVQVRAGVGESGQLWVEVEDEGPGIPLEARERIFERFIRLEGAEEAVAPGTGIGLSLVKELVELHGGQVTVESGAHGTGALFRVHLPQGWTEDATPEESFTPPSQPVPTLPAELPALVETARRTLLSPAPGGARILVVEDHQPLRRFLVDFLSSHFQVLEASDGEEGLLAARRELPDLVLTDVMMPRRSGASLAQALKADARTAHMPVILLTAQRGPRFAAEGLQSGGDDYVPKPFSPDELLARVRSQLRIRALSRELAQAQKLSMLGTLAAGLAHEVRNPLNAIVNGVPLVRQTVAKGAHGPERAVALELLEVMEEAAGRAAALTRDLLSFSHAGNQLPGQGSPPPSRWRPSAGVEATLKLLSLRTREVTVHRDLPAELHVEGHPERLNQVVMNLLDNALRAVGQKGQVWVRATGEAERLTLSVRDDGPGISPELLPRLFDPFFTTRAVGSGTGLGLHLSRQIVEAHGGKLEVRSQPGQGAEFSFWVPRTRPTTEGA